MSLRYSSLFRNDPFFYDPFSSITSSFFDPFFTTDTPMLMSTSNNTNSSNTNNSNNNQQLQQSSTNNNNNSNNTSMVGHQSKNHRPTGALSLFSPLIAARNVPMPDMKVDMFTTPTAYDIHAHCSGIDKNDINITIEDRVLNIQAERKQVTKRQSNGKSSATSPAQITEEKNNNSNTSSTNDNKMQEEAKTSTPPTTDNSKTSSTSSSNNNNNSTVSTNNKSNANMNDDDSDMGQYDYIENVYGQVQRSFTLPEDAEPSGLTAKYEDGVIRIHIPRTQQQKPQKQKITLQ